MHRITRIGERQVTDEELGPQIDWERLRLAIYDADMSIAQFCYDVHVSPEDFRRYLRCTGSPPSARVRHRVAYHVAVLEIDDGTIVSEGTQPPTRLTKVG